MKKAKYWLLGALGLALSLGTVGCGGDEGSSGNGKFSFTVKLASGNTNGALVVGQTDKIEITPTNEPKNAHYTYEVPSSGAQYFRTDDDGTVHALKATPDKTSVRIAVKETTKNVGPVYLKLTAYDAVEPAKGGKNWASDVTVREEILGELEEYAMSNYLTGIALFENAGYTRFSSRATPGTTKYITGYGLGTLSEGELDTTKTLNTDDDYPSYFHQGTSSNPGTVNGWDAQGSDVSDLFGYITSSFWGTRMNSSKNGYEWYPVLARDVENKGDKSRPITTEEPNDLKMYRTWKIYVKTGAENEGGIKYRYSGDLDKDYEASKKYNNRPVELADYETVLMAMLTQKSNVFRGAELAGDTTYGIKGAGAYFRRTGKNISASKAKEIWEEMKGKEELGIKTGTDTKGSYIQLELLNPIDDFTAMYTLSSNLYSPIPLAFLEDIGDGDFTKGMKIFGTFNGKMADDAILDYAISCGPFFLQDWTKDQEMVFGRNDDWFEVSDTRYKIEGVHYRYFKEAASDSEYIYKQFRDAKILDVTGLPATCMGERLGTDIQSEGDSTFKLNVNSCTQTRWNELFGDNGTNNNTSNPKKDNYYICKPWMSNINFLNGIYWSINRKEFAESQGVTPSFNYFSNSYLSDPEKGTSYNGTDTHKKAVAKFHNVKKDSEGHIIDDDYGYNFGSAKAYFKQAVDELVAKGQIVKGKDKDHPTEISISIGWMYQNDIKQYGNKIVKYITDAFNDDSVSNGLVKLVIPATEKDYKLADGTTYRGGQFAVTKWDDIYSKHLQIGCYDLGFGAISGNSYNPLNFLEVLKSDNSSGFTLNWGLDTSKVDEKNPIIYKDQSWSFDALWAAADHGTVTRDGKNINPATHNYISAVKDSAGNDQNNVYLGANFTINFEFFNDESVELEIDELHLYLLGVGSVVIPKDKWNKVKNADGSYTITFALDATTAAQYDKDIYDANKLEDKIGTEGEIEHPFTYDSYNDYWNIEVYYTMRLLGGAPSQIIDNTAKNATADAKR